MYSTICYIGILLTEAYRERAFYIVSELLPESDFTPLTCTLLPEILRQSDLLLRMIVTSVINATIAPPIVATIIITVVSLSLESLVFSGGKVPFVPVSDDNPCSFATMVIKPLIVDAVKRTLIQ